MNSNDKEKLKVFDFNYAKQKPVIKPKGNNGNDK